MPVGNVRRQSTRICDSSYRPRTTWDLPEIVSVSPQCFATSEINTSRFFFRFQGVLPTAYQRRPLQHRDGLSVQSGSLGMCLSLL